MGEVYLATDSKLDRRVAIKVLPDTMTGDHERVARFEREAKLLASLNHPNIAAIHGFDDLEGTRFLVMEYVQGQTLGDHLKNGPVAVEDALDIGKQIAEALEAAHGQGVIHRDLKPANVMIREDGTLKVLDFGLAKAMAEESSGSVAADSPTITANYTRPGVILGTAAYMSPEQARGKPHDKRTDIWSFGCVLYETFTGKRTFDGQTTSDVMARILEREPDMSVLPENVPTKIRDLLRRCLEKQQRRRLRDIGDAVLELDEAVSTRSWTTSAIMAAASPISRASLPKAALTWTILLIVGIAVGWLAPSPMNPRRATTTEKRSERQVSRLSISIPDFLWPGSVRLSPAGRRLAAIGECTGDSTPDCTQLFIRSFDDSSFRPLPGTTGARKLDFSPDGKWLAFYVQADRLEDGVILSKVAVDGSTPPLQLTTIGPKWQFTTDSSPSLVWVRQDELQVLKTLPGVTKELRVSAQTGNTTVVDFSHLDSNFMNMFAVSRVPRRDAILYNVNKYVDGAWQMGVWALPWQADKSVVLTENGSHGTVTTTGHLLYTRGQRLLATRFDAERLETIGGPVAMVDGLRTTESWENGAYDLSNNGTLAFLPGGRVGAKRRLATVDHDGKLVDFVHAPRALEQSVSASRDGKRAIAMIANAKGLYELWLTELGVPRFTRFAADPDGDCSNAIWNRSGDYIYYVHTGRQEKNGIYRRSSDLGAGAELVVTANEAGGRIMPVAFSADDRFIIIEKRSDGGTSIHRLTLATENGQSRELELLLGGSFDTSGADLSLDGNWLAYGSNESGRNELYIRALNADGSLGKPIPATTEGGRFPQWAPEGNSLYYWGSKGKIMILPVDHQSGRPTSAPRVAVDLDAQSVDAADFSTLPDGKLLVIHKGADEAEPTRIEIVLNWLEELKHKVPTGSNP
jgi:serine/threonine protein kinase